MRKLLLTLLIVVVLFVTLLIAQNQIILRVWDRVPQMEKVVQMFNEKMAKEGKNIRAEFELIPYAQQVPKFMAALAAGKAPDVYSLDLIQYPYFISIGAFRDITDWFNTLPYKDEFPKGLMKLGMKDGRVYAIPYEVDLSVIFWNKDMFKEVGLDPNKPPETWDELIEYAKKLTKDKDNDGVIDQWGFAVGDRYAGGYMFWFMPFVWSNGGRMFDEKGNVVLYSPETVEALQLWYDLVHKYKVAPAASVQWSANDRYNAFVSGRLAIALLGNFNVPNLLKDAPNLNFGVAPIPRGKDGYATFGGGNLIGITTQCKHPEAAWEFVKFALSDEVMIEAFAPNLILLPRSSLYDNKYYNKVPQMKKFGEILKYAITPYTLKYNELYDPVLTYFQGALLGKIGVEEAVKRCHEEIEKIMKK